MTRLKYYSFRFLHSIFLLFIILTFLFFFFRLMPGDFTARMTYQGATQEAIEAFEEDWGLNDPLYVQYYRYIINFVTLEFGTSVEYRVPVNEWARMRMFNSFILIAPGITLAYVLGSLIGTLQGYLRGRLFEKSTMIPIITVGAFPEFFTSILLIIIFAGYFGFFPSSGLMTAETAGAYDAWWRPYLTRDFAYHYTLPLLAVILRYLYFPTLIMRTSVVEAKDQAFMFYQRVTGLPKSKTLRNLGKHSILPVVTLYPVSMTRAIGGLVLIETVFNWPGMGFALVQAVFARDYPVLQFVFFGIAVFIVVANFLVDIFYGYIDPRVSVGAEK